MPKDITCSVAVATAALVTMATFASPAAAEEIVPSGCAGTLFYVCTGDAGPPSPAGYKAPSGNAHEIRIWSQPQTVVPGMTVGGQGIGGIVIPVGGEIVLDTTVTVGGPTSPIDTGVTAPVSVCAFVACYAAGDPVVVPGVDVPFVPGVIPAVTAPSETVEVPAITTLPQQSTPDITVPAYDVATITLNLEPVADPVLWYVA